MSPFVLNTCADETELSRVLEIISGALHFPRDLATRFADVSGRENFRALRSAAEGHAIVGGLVIHPMGQYFGGRNVAMGGIGGVGIAPEHRAGGAATAMMKLAVREMHSRGTPISTLYPATVPVYRRAGYELAGSRYEITIPLRSLHLPKGAEAMRIERLNDADRPEVERLYLEQARPSSGALHRGNFSWRRVYEPRGEKAIGYKVVNDRREMEGCVFLLQKDAPQTSGQRAINAAVFALVVNEVQFRTPRAGLRILELLRQHRSVGAEATLYGSPDHPLLWLIPERIFTAQHQFHWMLRINDVEKALLARGWNPAVAGEVAFTIRDDVVEANDGTFTLRVAGGEARVQRGGKADVVIDVRGLAALYTGHMTPHDLMNTGLMHATDDAKRATTAAQTLAGLFAGPRPYLADMF